MKTLKEISLWFVGAWTLFFVLLGIVVMFSAPFLVMLIIAVKVINWAL